jgi:hypothetical protein
MRNILVGFLIGFSIGFLGVILLVGLEYVNRDTIVFGFIGGLMFGGICALLGKSLDSNKEK